MSRHDAYYEPEDDYCDSDEFAYEVDELLKDEYSPSKWDNFCEAFAGVQDPELVSQLEEMLEKRDFENLGRKLWGITYDHCEKWAIEKALGNI